MNEREADIRSAFCHLRNMCDPRGHDLLRLLEEQALESEQGARILRDSWLEFVGQLPEVVR